MAKTFNVTADCKPDMHYMVNIDQRLLEIKELIDDGKYFTINRARQYGKTTTLRALGRYLQKNYYIVSIDFQTFGNAKFKNENTFSISFGSSFLRALKRNKPITTDEFRDAIARLQKIIDELPQNFELKELFEELSDICDIADKRIILMIDEVDSATNNQVFLDFLSQLRAYYIDRDIQPTFQSVILAGVYDVKNLKRKLRPNDKHKVNSPWNIAADFLVDMSFSVEDIAGMLAEYETDYQTGMNIEKMSKLLYDYTSGYPYLVSRLCKFIDERIADSKDYPDKSSAWTKNGFLEAVKLLLKDQNSLFESLIGKLNDFPELDKVISKLLFQGQSIAYNPDDLAIQTAQMFGFVKVINSDVVIANKIFETRLYNNYLLKFDEQNSDIYSEGSKQKSQFIIDGHLNVRRVLEKFVETFDYLYGDQDETFLEDAGRKYFMLFLRPIINGTGNCYVEPETRNRERMDLVIDYHGEQHICELKIWHGNTYNERGEEQLSGYLNYFNLKKGYMLSFNFNKKKEIGVKEIIIDDKTLIEAVV